MNYAKTMNIFVLRLIIIHRFCFIPKPFSLSFV